MLPSPFPLPSNLSLPFISSRRTCSQESTVGVSQLLLEFFAHDMSGVMRPLTNSNVLLDFNRHKECAYYSIIVKYLRSLDLQVPDYDIQYKQLHE